MKTGEALTVQAVKCLIHHLCLFLDLILSKGEFVFKYSTSLEEVTVNYTVSFCRKRCASDLLLHENLQHWAKLARDIYDTIDAKKLS